VPLAVRAAVTVNPRRLGEWLNGRSVPRAFDQLLAVVQAINGGPAGLSAQQWQRLWQAPRGSALSPRPYTGQAARPGWWQAAPTDAAALCVT